MWKRPLQKGIDVQQGVGKTGVLSCGRGSASVHTKEISYGLEITREIHARHKWISPLSLFITLGVIHWIGHSLIILVVLIPLWFILFRPFDRADVIPFVIATVFIVGQNHSVLPSGRFEFAEQDILLMPYYEPFMW